MKRNGSRRLVGTDPMFVTAADLEAASEIEAELNRRCAHSSSIDSQQLNLRFREAYKAYPSSPTDQNWNALLAFAKELVFCESVPGQKLRRIIHEGINQFVRDTFCPWAQTIIDRGLAQANKNLADLTSVETERYEQLTGEHLGNRSVAILEKAREPVRRLEAVLRSVVSETQTTGEHQVRSFLRLLRDHHE